MMSEVKTTIKSKSSNIRKETQLENDALSKKYQKKTQLEHIRDLPDTYIGSIEFKETNEYIIVNVNGKDTIKQKTIQLNPGFINIVEEILVNAIDAFSRTEQKNKTLKGKHKLKGVTNINITIDKDGKISIFNNGDGIDIAEHPTEKIYIPQMIFGELLTSGNYDKSEEKITGGKNGYGAKLTNIYSTYFKVETIDRHRKLKYEQEFKNNLDIKEKPVITKYKKEPYTQISFIPDYKKFGMETISDDMMSLIKKRAYDIVATTNGKVEVSFNGEKISVKDFKSYMSLYIDKSESSNISVNVSESNDIEDANETNDEEEDANLFVHQVINDRWMVGACLTPTFGFKQVSFVNGINTTRGGKQVDYIIKQFTSHIVSYIKKKKKIDVKENVIKENIMIFVISTIVNPSFDSQTKETLTTNKSKFGSECIVPTKMIDELANMGVIERAINLSKFQDTQLLIKTDGKKRSKILDIEKLDDAKYAGTKYSKECTLILTEGDSAKAMAVAGLSVITNGRNYYGIYPLRGKLLNTRGDGKEKMIANNQEIIDIKRIMGLQEGKEYKNLDSLRYGKIMVMTDQDVDGTHIKGLFINFMSKWPSLLKYDGFLNGFLTPIVKVKKGKKTSINFYNINDYEKWVEKNNGKGWTSKYYKGLGTSTPNEAKEYFRDFKKMDYIWEDTEGVSSNSIDMAFNSKRADDRKEWLSKYDANLNVDTNQSQLTYTDFIDKDLIHFSNYDNHRSIPSMCDGLKPSQRKILYCSFKRNLVKEIRVAQLAGYVSENGAYHHGEMSLNGAIVNMAQNYVGNSNINLLEPIGQFGSRLKGGKDSAQPRYIHTHLTNLTNIIYDKRDNALYNYTDDDGQKVEPFFYVPIIPMILVNGSEGIGTGWSSGVPQFNPLDIIKNIKKIMKDEEPTEMVPWVRGFKGTIKKISKNHWITKGVYNLTDLSTIVITELPVGMWTDNYRILLDSLMTGEPIQSSGKGRGGGKGIGRGRGKTTNTKDKDGKEKKEKIVYLKDYTNESSESQVRFILKFDKKILNTLISNTDKSGINGFEIMFRMTSKISCDKKLNVYNDKCKLVNYTNIDDILKDYYKVRIEYYQLRKNHMIQVMENNLMLISIKVKFILDIINKKIIVNNRSKKDIREQLISKKYPQMINNKLFKLIEENDKLLKSGDGSYDYLIKMPIYNLTKERIEEFKKDLNDIESEYNILKQKTLSELWCDDLTVFEKEYSSFTKAYYSYMGFEVKDFEKVKHKKLVIRDKHSSV
jgi:DNA topoisomerase II